MNSLFIKHVIVSWQCVFISSFLISTLYGGGGGGQARIQVFFIDWRGVRGPPMSLAGPGRRPRGRGEARTESS